LPNASLCLKREHSKRTVSPKQRESSKAARKVCFNDRVVPNIPENLRNRKHRKRGRKRLFNPEVYKHRFSAERTFAWIDKFKALLVRFERKDAYFFGLHCLAFALINLCDLVS